MAYLEGESAHWSDRQVYQGRGGSLPLLGSNPQDILSEESSVYSGMLWATFCFCF